MILNQKPVGDSIEIHNYHNIKPLKLLLMYSVHLKLLF